MSYQQSARHMPKPEEKGNRSHQEKHQPSTCRGTDEKCLPMSHASEGMESWIVTVVVGMGQLVSQYAG
jgi:hypothetical protein